MAKMLDGMEAMLRGEAPPPAAATLLGMRLASFSAGEALVELVATAAHGNPMGTVQGGVLAAEHRRHAVDHLRHRSRLHPRITLAGASL